MSIKGFATRVGIGLVAVLLAACTIPGASSSTSSSADRSGERAAANQLMAEIGDATQLMLADDPMVQAGGCNGDSPELFWCEPMAGIEWIAEGCKVKFGGHAAGRTATYEGPRSSCPLYPPTSSTLTRPSDSTDKGGGDIEFLIPVAVEKAVLVGGSACVLHVKTVREQEQKFWERWGLGKGLVGYTTDKVARDVCERYADGGTTNLVVRWSVRFNSAGWWSSQPNDGWHVKM